MTRISPLEPTGLNRLWIRSWVYFSFNIIMRHMGMKEMNREEFEELWTEQFNQQEQEYAIKQGWA